jgi:hypothetical protein
MGDRGGTVKVELGEVLTRAWQITWKNKVLWAISALPILVSFLMIPIWLVFVFAGDFDPERMFGFLENQWVMIVASLFYLIIIVVSFFLQITSRSSSTLGIYRVEAGIQPLTFMSLIKDGFQYFWRILGISLLLALVVMAFFIVFFACISAVSIVTMGIGAICLQPLFLLFIPLTLLGMAFMEQAEAAVVVDGLGVMDAAKRGYELVRANLLTFALITVVIYFGMSILSSLLVFPFMIPMFFFMMPNLESGMPDFNNIFRMQAVFMVVLLPIMTLVQGFSLTYLKSAMMVTYLRLTRSASAPPPEVQEATA